jgi:type I restriction-modification system DNA methylase subunit
MADDQNQKNDALYYTHTHNINRSQLQIESMSISNREALKDKIHDIHNALRNNGAGYGMNALKVFNILYGLKKIEENGLIDKVGLKRPECEFSYLLKLATTSNDKDADITNLLFGPILTSISESEIRDLLFYEIPRNIKTNVMPFLIKEIDKITMIEKTCNVLLSGKIYEYFIGRDESAISELGAYFTDRHIVDYIYERLDIGIDEDQSIGSMVDMFGGSGGFTTGYINYLNSKYGRQIDWNTEINKIHHYDMNEDVIKSAGLEFFCLTGVLPNLNNMKYKNSFTDDFVDASTGGDKTFKYVITNPPYGGDKNKKSGVQDKREKIKEYIKKDLETITDEQTIKHRREQLKGIEAQEKAEKKEQEKTNVCLASCSKRINRLATRHKVKGNDKEACSLMLMMELLEDGGTACGVLKEGVFFSKTYKELRKLLVSEFNVQEVISVPQDQFENTSTKTSIIIFKKTVEKTSEVVFRDLVVDRYEEDVFEEIDGNIVLIENKGDIKCVNDVIVSQASADEILKNPICSLNGKDYNKKQMRCGADYNLVKLGDVCSLLNGFAFKSKDYSDEGISLLSIKHLPECDLGECYYIKEDKKYDKYKINQNDILIALSGNTIGKFGIYLNTFKSYLNQRVAKLMIDNDAMNMYIYYVFHAMDIQKGIIEISNQSAQPNVSSIDIEKLQIPIPKSQDKLKEWVEKISAPFDRKNENERKLKELENNVKDKIKYITENEDCEEVKLGDILQKIKPSKTIHTKDLDNKGIYPFYNKIGECLGYHSCYNYDVLKSIMITKDGGSGPKIYGDNISLGGCMIIEGKFTSTSANIVLGVSTEHNIQYIQTILKLNKNKIMDLANYSVKIGHIQYSELSAFKIKIPKNKQLISDLEPLFKQIEDLQKEIKEDEGLFKQYITDLKNEAIPEDSPQEVIEEEIQPQEDTDNRTETASTMSSKSSVKELKEQCKSLGIKGYSTLKKEQLIEKIRNHKA